MLVAYAKEKQQIVDKYIRLKPWYEGDLQKSVRERNSLQNETEPDPITNRPEWSGTEFWEQCFNAELKQLNLAYEKYFPKNNEADDDNIKYTWVGINPDIKEYPTMLSLYNRLKELPKIFQHFEAVVEGHTKNGYRPHIHMVLFTKVKPYRIVQTLSKFFKCQPQFVEVKNYKKFYSEKIDYIRGKKDKEKMPYVLKDREERLENNIPNTLCYLKEACD